MSDSQPENPRHAALQTLHLEIQDLLAGYLDGELSEKDRGRVEAHLAGCSVCAEDLERQRLLQRQLASLPREQLAADQRRRLEKAIQAASPADRYRGRTLSEWLTGWLFPHPGLKLAALGGWTAAVVLAGLLWVHEQPLSTGTAIPMVQDAIAEYRKAVRSPLPMPEAAEQATAPLRWPRARVLTSWSTRIGGRPARAFAVKNGAAVVLQIQVDDEVFYRNPKVRQALAKKGRYQYQRRELEVVAQPLAEGGVLIVGPPDRLPRVTATQTRL